MNSQPIIITESRLFLRCIDSLLTVLAWAGFIYLISHEYQLLFPSHRLVNSDGSGSGAVILLYYGFFALIYVLIFILWAKYNQYFFTQERRKRKDAPNKAILAKSFHISVHELEELTSNRVIRVHHDKLGVITDTEILTIADNYAANNHRS